MIDTQYKYFIRDGIPIYGYCKDASGVQFSSCFSLVSGATESEVDMAAGTFMSASLDSSYEYSASGDCNLDEANGNFINFCVRYISRELLQARCTPSLESIPTS